MKNRLSIVRIDDCELISGHGQACFPEHTHRSFTLVLIMSGHPEITVNGKTVGRWCCMTVCAVWL